MNPGSSTKFERKYTSLIYFPSKPIFVRDVINCQTWTRQEKDDTSQYWHQSKTIVNVSNCIIDHLSILYLILGMAYECLLNLTLRSQMSSSSTSNMSLLNYLYYQRYNR
jgi:hypothetical protein